MVKAKLVTIFSLISGLVLAFSLPFFNLGGLVWVGFVPLLLALAILKPSSSGFGTGYLTGLIYFGFTFRWFWDVYPLKTLGISNPWLAFILLFLVWSLTVAGMALFWGVSTWLLKKTEPRFSWSILLIFPSIFTFLEYLRSFLISLLWFAPGMAVGPHWTFGNLAYALSDSFAVLSFSSLVGIYGVTFLIAAINVLIFLLFEQRRKATALLSVSLVLALTYFPFFFFIPPSTSATLPVAIVQTKITSQPETAERLTAFRKQLESLDQIARQYPTTRLVVFPEGGDFFTSLSLFGNAQTLSQYFDQLFPSSTIIVDNTKINEGKTSSSRTISLDTKKGILGFYNKYLLTPGGEYVPGLIRKLDQILALDSPTLRTVTEFSPGKDYPPVTSEDFSWQSLVCSDIASPLLSRSAGGTTDLLTVQASFAFADGSPDLVAQTRAMALFRGAENRKSLLFASNFGPSFLASPFGKITASTRQSGFEILTGTLVLKKGQTVYNKIGDGPIVVASLGVLVLSLFWKNKHSRI